MHANALSASGEVNVSISEVKTLEYEYPVNFVDIVNPAKSTINHT